MSTNATAANPVEIPEAKLSALEALTRAPVIAWPTVGVLG